MRTLIKGGTLINEGRQQVADIIVVDDRIEDIVMKGISTENVDSFDYVVDAEGCIVMPGVIDSHVHFREPGLTHKADMESESRAAVYGGVTSVFEMPNTKPQTTTQEALLQKETLAKGRMHVNYAFFPGATNDNIEMLRGLDIHAVPGIKLFMGSSTGNMLVDREEALDEVFSVAKEKNLPVMAHCEDTDTINANMARLKEQLATDDPDVTFHPQIRSAEACLKSSSFACQLAERHEARLHIAHVSTAEELSLLGGNITGEATVAHLLFTDDDYRTLGARIKCNPAIKGKKDREALRKAVAKGMAEGGIAAIGTDHAPHAWEEKQGGAAKAMSGMPSIQFSLVAMLGLTDEGVLDKEQLVNLMCHNPAKLFEVNERGFLRKGYKADIVIARREEQPWQVTKDCLQGKCGWSPMEGMTFAWRVTHTMINGALALNDGTFDDAVKGEHITFRG